MKPTLLVEVVDRTTTWQCGHKGVYGSFDDDSSFHTSYRTYMSYWNPDAAIVMHEYPSSPEAMALYTSNHRLSQCFAAHWLVISSILTLTQMHDFPSAADIVDDVMNHIQFQAPDQVKAAIKNGALPYDVSVKWILVAGPYFCIQDFGPFDDARLTTQIHRPNDKGDEAIMEIYKDLKKNARFRPC